MIAEAQSLIAEAQDRLIEAKTNLATLRAQKMELELAIKDAEEDHRIADAYYQAIVRRVFRRRDCK